LLGPVAFEFPVTDARVSGQLIDKKVDFVDAVDPDLGRFKANGGKLLLYAGWSDTSITPENTVLYYESVHHQYLAYCG
jgi:hypothetical protein